MSGARPDTWMPMYWPKYLGDTSHLGMAEHGAYLLLIGHYWTTGKPLPDNDAQLARIVRARGREWQKVKPIIASFFHIENGAWRHSKVEVLLADARVRYERRAKAGAIGGASKREAIDKQTDSNALSIATAMQKHTRARDNLQSPNGDTKPTDVGLGAAVAPAPPTKPLPAIPPELDRRKGSRLHPDWQLPDEWRFWAEDQQSGVDIDLQAQKFANHWWAKSGKDATKVDWFATWRNWILNAKGYDNAKRPNVVSDLEIFREVARQGS